MPDYQQLIASTVFTERGYQPHRLQQSIDIPDINRISMAEKCACFRHFSQSKAGGLGRMGLQEEPVTKINVVSRQILKRRRPAPLPGPVVYLPHSCRCRTCPTPSRYRPPTAAVEAPGRRRYRIGASEAVPQLLSTVNTAIQ